MYRPSQTPRLTLSSERIALVYFNLNCPCARIVSPSGQNIETIKNLVGMNIFSVHNLLEWRRSRRRQEIRTNEADDADRRVADVGSHRRRIAHAQLPAISGRRSGSQVVRLLDGRRAFLSDSGVGREISLAQVPRDTNHAVRVPDTDDDDDEVARPHH